MDSPRDHDRRRALRVPAPGAVAVLSLSRQMPTALHDVSVTGFAVVTSQPVEVGESHRFAFLFLDSGSPILVDATCVRCVYSPAWTQIEPMFLAGFAFDSLDARARDILAAFIDQRSIGAPTAAEV